MKLDIRMVSRDAAHNNRRCSAAHIDPGSECDHDRLACNVHSGDQRRSAPNRELIYIVEKAI